MQEKTQYQSDVEQIDGSRKLLSKAETRRAAAFNSWRSLFFLNTHVFTAHTNEDTHPDTTFHTQAVVDEPWGGKKKKKSITAMIDFAAG